MKKKHVKDLKYELREKARIFLQNLSQSDREELLIKNWMSHDARWFIVVAAECGLEKANQMNMVAANEVGKVESKRITRVVDIPEVECVEDLMFAQEALISIVGPNLMEYTLTKVNNKSYVIDVERCFAYENVKRAGVADTYQCGIFSRIAGWLDTISPKCEIKPPLGKCLKASGKNCFHIIALTQGVED